MHFIHVDFLSCYPLTTRSTLIGCCCVQMGEAENAGRLQVPEIGFFFEKDSWRFGGGEWAQVIDAL